LENIVPLIWIQKAVAALKYFVVIPHLLAKLALNAQSLPPAY
jgi:hypothetical protein